MVVLLALIGFCDKKQFKSFLKRWRYRKAGGSKQVQVIALFYYASKKLNFNPPLLSPSGSLSNTYGDILLGVTPIPSRGRFMVRKQG